MSDSHYINGIDNDWESEVSAYRLEELTHNKEIEDLKALIQKSNLSIAAKKRQFAYRCMHLEINREVEYKHDEYGKLCDSWTKFRSTCKRCGTSVESGNEHETYNEVLKQIIRAVSYL